LRTHWATVALAVLKLGELRVKRFVPAVLLEMRDRTVDNSLVSGPYAVFRYPS
jgi:hypothetical protein